MKAWFSELHGVQSIVFADTRAQATAKTQRSAADAWGKENAKWCDIRVTRYPEYDHADEAVKNLHSGYCFSVESVDRNRECFLPSGVLP